MVKRLVLYAIICFVSVEVSAQFSEKKLQLLESMVYQVMDSLQIPGLQIAITQRDAVKFIKGYGVTDMQHQTKVDPFASAFQIGSITTNFYCAIHTACSQPRHHFIGQGHIELLGL